MRINKILIVLVVLVIFLSTGCSKAIKNYGDEILVEKQVSGWDKYEHYNEIKGNNLRDKCCFAGIYPLNAYLLNFVLMLVQ